MAEELASLRAELDQAKQTGSVADLKILRSEVINATQTAQRAEKSANEWKNTTSVTHLAGYAAAGYTNQENGTDSFDVANFNPIFHFQYGDRILWESELEIEVDENGETEVALEYSTIDIFLNDYLVLVAGKFVSPIGNFRQNAAVAQVESSIRVKKSLGARIAQHRRIQRAKQGRQAVADGFIGIDDVNSVSFAGQFGIRSCCIDDRKYA